MNKRILLISSLLMGAFSSNAQKKVVSFQIVPPEEKVANSLYNSIQLLDIRKDTTDFGIVQKGLLNRRVKVTTDIPMAEQLSGIVDALTDHTAQNGKLLLLLRQCSFAEVTNAMSEKGYFHFRAVLFSHENDAYKRIVSIDTVTMVKAMDVTQKMLRLGEGVITSFIAEYLKQAPNEDMTLSINQLPKIDSIEKSRLPFYISGSYVDGIYYSFNSFVYQQPDEGKVSAVLDKNGKLRQVSYTDKDGQKEKIKNRATYAVVYEGKPYVSTKYGFYLLEKRDNDFYFIGKASNYTTIDIVTAEIFFGVIGGLIAQSATALFEMKLDHLSGGFIRIRALSPPSM